MVVKGEGQRQVIPVLHARPMGTPRMMIDFAAAASFWKVAVSPAVA